jgi:glycine cleavage system aminomethyltransferase T
VAKNVALAYLPAPLARPGTRLHLECFGERVPAVVEAAPLHDAAGLRVRS